MMINKKNLIIYSLLLFLMSCGGATEEIIDLPLADKSGKIVIEGNITDNPGPYLIRVTKSIKMSQSNDYPEVKNAVVTLKDNKGQMETLKYEDGFYMTKNFVSHYGDTYTLSVTVDGISYVATSKMPQKVELNSLKQKEVTSETTSFISIIPIYKDPIALGNYYVFKSYVNGNNGGYSVLSDNINNGQENTLPILIKNDIIKKKDTVVVEMRCVDAPVYNYYSALPQVILGSGVNVVSANPANNISNGALGYFSANASSFKEIIIK